MKSTQDLKDDPITKRRIRMLLKSAQRNYLRLTMLL
jgi:hypothetical protein